MLLEIKKLNSIHLEWGRYGQANYSTYKAERVLVVIYMLTSYNSSHD